MNPRDADGAELPSSFPRKAIQSFEKPPACIHCIPSRKANTIHPAAYAEPGFLSSFVLLRGRIIAYKAAERPKRRKRVQCGDRRSRRSCCLLVVRRGLMLRRCAGARCLNLSLFVLICLKNSREFILYTLLSLSSSVALLRACSEATAVSNFFALLFVPCNRPRKKSSIRLRAARRNTLAVRST